MEYIVFVFVVFVTTITVIELVIYAYKTVRYPNRGRIRKRLRGFSSHEHAPVHPDLLKKRRVLSRVTLLDRILRIVPGIDAVDRIVRQANTGKSLGFFLLLSMVLATFGFLIVTMFSKWTLVPLLAAGLLGSIPFFYVHSKRKNRMRKFERQLPDALDLIARALRAGHAFTSGMTLASDEFDDPLGTEFRETLDEINFGVSVQDALRHLAERVDCQDLRYFIVSVILQRETGGNLAEIIETIARIIRERFKLRGKIRVLSAEGRLSAMILTAIPFVIIFALRVINPEYHVPLFTETAGKIMAGAAVFLMVLGIWCMKKMVDIRV